jgi:hypothetical protein
VLIFGIITTYLLLPIEDYIEDPTQQVVNENELIVNGYHSIDGA